MGKLAVLMISTTCLLKSSKNYLEFLMSDDFIIRMTNSGALCMTPIAAKHTPKLCLIACVLALIAISEY